MSKRFILPEQSGERKKPRLDFSVTDHNFPLSQNAGSKNALDDFDEIDDELLLQASQACEQACNASVLPAYSQLGPPALTSTQLLPASGPSSSGSVFSFKKPTASISNTISTYLKDKCDRISSPLRGIANKVGDIETIDLTDNFFNDKVLDDQDSDYVYRQLLKLKEENAKLKSENGKLLEKCVTKEGEASILRTQLKTYQVAVDNARLEKIKVREEAQIQWSDKLNAVNKQMSDLRTELDSKNLEVISIKEKCKMLESNKIKLTQITLAGNDNISRMNNSMVVSNSFLPSQPRKLRTVSCTVQTENCPQFLKLSKPCKLEKSNLTQILPLVMDSAADHQHCILDYNEKLKKPTDLSPSKCRIYSSFYRLSTTDPISSSRSKGKVDLSAIYEDLMYIAACNSDVEIAKDQYINIFNATRTALENVQCELETISKRLTSAFQKEMDKRYIEVSTTYTVVTERDLISGNSLFNEEQAILARRMVAVLHHILADEKAVKFFMRTQKPSREAASEDASNEFIELLSRICSLLDSTSCGVLYTGLLLSITFMLERLLPQCPPRRLLAVGRSAVAARAAPPAPPALLRAVCGVSAAGAALCGRGGGLRQDHEQGVLLYKRDSCLLQVLLRQVEASLEVMDRRDLVEQLADTTGHLLRLHAGCQDNDLADEEEVARCKCDQVLVQVLVYALRICATKLNDRGCALEEERRQGALLAACRGGLAALHRRWLRAPEPAPRPEHSAGHLLEYCELMQRYPHDEYYSTMLSEMCASLQAAAEEAPAPYHRQAALGGLDAVMRPHSPHAL